MAGVEIVARIERRWKWTAGEKDALKAAETAVRLKALEIELKPITQVWDWDWD